MWVLFIYKISFILSADGDEDDSANGESEFASVVKSTEDNTTRAVLPSSNTAGTSTVHSPTVAESLSENDFISQKLTTKLKKQMLDPLVLASNALPSWCEDLTSSCPVLFPFEARQLFFSCTAFGVSRTIAWIQNQHDLSEKARLGYVSRWFLARFSSVGLSGFRTRDLCTITSN